MVRIAEAAKAAGYSGWVHTPPNPEEERFKIVIVGAGFSGLAMAIRLKREGEQDFVLLERADDLGGVWRDNVYPGCACDVESHLYSFSFAPNPNWSHHFSPQGEIRAYLKEVAQRFGVLPHIRFRHEVTRMEWQEARGEWVVETLQGTYRARIVVGAFGWLSDPAIPKLRGMDSFKGRIFHSATWPGDFDLKGKRVAVVGTGASAIQFIPAIQPDVAFMYVFQRTPAWVLPRNDRAFSPATQRLFRRLPLLQKATRLKIYVQREMLLPAFRHPRVMKLMEKVALKHLRDAIKDPVLAAKLTPRYALGCKRILLSNDYYPALAQPNIEVITTGIREVTADGVVDASGARRDVDAIIFGTGFEVKDPPFARYICGADGRTLAEVWTGSPRAYLGTTVAGFPNFFLLPGPNTGLGHTSVIYMSEAQVEHAARVIKYMKREGFDIIEPTASAQRRFSEEMDRGMAGTVWTAGGCDSWYLDRTGRNSALWPGFTFAFRRMAARLDTRDYEGRRVGQARDGGSVTAGA